ncbi:MAG TPA: hypothetical protein VEH07_07275, partial [Alphaproteobacteria bacterium]|nr:hypothetical protein [Alphaproteobacteria bacterium]
RLAAAGVHPVRILRALGLHFDRLASLELGKGGYGYYQAEALKRHAARWPARNIARAQSLVLEAEMQCKTTGLPAEEISERTLLVLARGAREAPRPRRLVPQCACCSRLQTSSSCSSVL